MANPPQPPTDGIADDFFEQIFSIPGYDAGADGSAMPGIVPQFNSEDGSSHTTFPVFPLELSLEQGRSGFSVGEGSSGGNVGRRIRHGTEVLHGQSLQAQVASVPQAPVPRPRVRARRGQATDPHSIAERLRREKIAERMRALQELVPNTNKTDRAAMLDEIVDYVKFLRLQVKVLSMSRLGGAGAVAQLVAEIPLSLVEGDSTNDGRSNQQVWDKWSTDGTEKQVTKLMEEDVGAAMQFLQSKALCIMPISLAAAIYHTQQQQPENSFVKNEPNTPPS